MDKLTKFNQNVANTNEILELKTGQTVKVYQKIKEGNKEKIQVFEGLIISKRGNKGINVNITVRKVNYGVGVERIFPIHSPAIAKIEVIKTSKVRRAKLFYMRELKGKQTRLVEKIVKKTPSAEIIEKQKEKNNIPSEQEKTVENIQK